MSDYLDFRISKRLKALGFPQKSVAAHNWVYTYGGHLVAIRAGLINPTLCPPIITADGKDGVFPWLESKGIEIAKGPSVTYAWVADLNPHNTDSIVIAADSPETLIEQCLDYLEKKRAPRA